MTEQPTAEWLASLASDGAFRIACSFGAGYDAPLRWYVLDIRPEDEPTVAGPFKTREAALARADKLNKESVA